MAYFSVLLAAAAVSWCSFAGAQTLAPAPLLATSSPLLQDVDLSQYGVLTTSTNNKIFLPPPLGTSQRSVCDIGPSVWCLSQQNQEVCGVNTNDTVGVCGYATTRGNCTEMTIPQFCSNQTLSPLAFNGGINGAPSGNLGLLVLALYWAPTSCAPNITTGGGFCSGYTTANSPAATNLQLHGMWPDTGSLYTTDPEPPAYTGAYQGFTQYCDDAFQCSVNGNLCSWPNATLANFTQSNYETCMRANNVTQCLVPEATVTALLPLFERYAAGYLGADRTFIDHEYHKHATCIGGYLTQNTTAFFERAVTWAAKLTASGSPFADLVQSNVGKNVSVANLQAAVGRQGSLQCTVSANNLCSLSEIWMCLGVDAAGFPTNLIDCPSGSQKGTCDPTQCANGTVLITSYPSTSNSQAAG